jgi:3-hydroxyacyl-[acyl-carrier-protein] dehydratase
MSIKEIEKNIIKNLPYSKPFLFVDKITIVTKDEITGTHKFLKNESFYKGHFTDNPITPGVMLVETSVQIGLVCFGIFLLDIYKNQKPFIPFLSHIETDFLEPVFPGETVTVHSEKIYFRYNILKCKIKMLNSDKKTVLTSTATCTFKFINE